MMWLKNMRGYKWVWMLFCITSFGCADSESKRIIKVLTPQTFQELIAMTPETIEKVDLARINLLCEQEALQTEHLDIQQFFNNLMRGLHS